ncbi:MAG: ribosomal protein S18-alanine N-acetyltransferase [archaeon]|nr:ribosomal protein S18-alanine N-acetyltransferase [archaeon]MCP8306649.1 ribosomal protein S18-alanine N-acetyltransferase [archaeon]
MELQKASLRKIGEYLIRRCKKEDLSQVASINWTSLPEHYSSYFFEATLNELPEAFLVVEKDRMVVGYIMCRIEYGMSVLYKFRIARKGHIISFAMLEQHRRKGLGRNLVEEALQALKDKGCSEIFLEVRISNSSAIGLYKKLGFKIVSTIRWYYRDEEDAYMMGRAL